MCVIFNLTNILLKYINRNEVNCSYIYTEALEYYAPHVRGVECATWLPETREPEKKTRESRHRAGQI